MLLWNSKHSTSLRISCSLKYLKKPKSYLVSIFYIVLGFAMEKTIATSLLNKLFCTVTFSGAASLLPDYKKQVTVFETGNKEGKTQWKHTGTDT